MIWLLHLAALVFCWPLLIVTVILHIILAKKGG